MRNRARSIGPITLASMGVMLACTTWLAQAWTASGTAAQGPVYQQDVNQPVKMIGSLTSDGYDVAGDLATNHVHGAIENWGRDDRSGTITLGAVSDDMTISVQWDNTDPSSATFKHDWLWNPDAGGESKVQLASFNGNYEVKVESYEVTKDGLSWWSGSTYNPYYYDTLTDDDALPHCLTTSSKLSDFVTASALQISMTTADCCLRTEAKMKYSGSWVGINGPASSKGVPYHQVFGNAQGQGRALVEAYFEIQLEKQ